MKTFYGVLIAIAVVGIAAVWWASQRSRGTAAQILEAPLELNASAFPGYVMGSESAPVEIVEYADFTCGACATFTVLQVPDIKSRLVDEGIVRLRFRGFALGQPSLLPLHAADCAGEQGRFWEMHDQLMYKQRDWITSQNPLRVFRDYAREIALDLDAYDQCMQEGRYAARLMATREEISNSGIHQTPTFDVGQLRVTGAISYDSLKVLVDRARGASN
jgi:protein-disulfide isomerase